MSLFEINQCLIKILKSTQSHTFLLLKNTQPVSDNHFTDKHALKSLN